MNVLVACEFSGIVRDAFIARGHDAMSCDLEDTEAPGPHYKGDVMDLLKDDLEWDLMIAHPPCTYLSNSGVRWLYSQDGRWDLMQEGAEFFKALLEVKIPYVAIENPIMHRYAKEIIGWGQDQIVQPWMFGHPEKKATCLWLRGLPELIATNNVRKEMEALPKNEANRVHYASPGRDRWKVRSRTLTGLADAMAEQWGSIT